MNTEIKVKSLEAIRLKETIDMTVMHNEVPYRFRVIVSDTPKRKRVKHIYFKEESVLAPSINKMMRKFIKNYFKEDY